MPRIRNKSANVLQLAQSLWRYGCLSAKEAQRDGKATGTVQEDSGKTYLAKHRFERCHRKKALTPAEKRELMGYALQEYAKLSLRQACKLFGMSTSVYTYKPKRKPDDFQIMDELKLLADLHKRWGFWKMYHRLRHLEYQWNHKRVYRIYKQLRLNLRVKRKTRLPLPVKKPLLRPIYPNITWSIDFMHDTLSDGSQIRSLNIIDDFNREVLTVALARSMPSSRVVRELQTLIDWRGKPERIRVDNGPEFIAEKMKDWCSKNQITLLNIQPGKPTQNSLIERFNRTFRKELLSGYMFESLKQVRMFAQAWMWMYNNDRPHEGLGHLTPRQFLLKYGKLEKMNSREFPTFQQDTQHNWKSLILDVAN